MKLRKKTQRLSLNRRKEPVETPVEQFKEE